MAINKTEELHNLDFTVGIRSQQINENFDLLRRWIEAERLRAGGWGLVEGFELTKDLSDFSIHVSEGTLINQDGKEVKVDEYKFIAGPPVYKELTEETVVGAEGLIQLEHPAYSNIEKHCIIYNPPQNPILHDEEFSILNLDTGTYLTTKDIIFIDQDSVIINTDYVGARIQINYLYANDRIDAILLKKDGSEYIYEIGIISTSPSQEVIKDYLDKGYYLIGFAYWHIGTEVDVQFITVDRTLRPIFVDENNNLYINGILYTGHKFIYFNKPDNPLENDLWYDTEKEILYIWRPNKETGEYEWKAINDLSRFYREYGIFTELENPDDLQTFTFEEKQNLRFIPGYNQLTIVIDQVVIMRDQFEELYDDVRYESDGVTGYGFKLKTPLERPSIVEVYCDHSVNTNSDAMELFPHIASFVDTKVFTIQSDTDSNIFTTDGEYELGNNQLEVWLNGVLLNSPNLFCELKADETASTADDLGILSNKFQVLVTLKAEDTITYRITRHMATYDNFRKVSDALNEKVNTAIDELHESQVELDNLINNVSSAINDIKESNTQLNKKVSTIENNYISKETGVTAEDLADDLKSKVISGIQYFNQSAVSSEITLMNFSENDFFSLYWINDMTRLILIRDTDYNISAIENGIVINLEPQWINDTAIIYIEAINLGA